MGARSTPIRVMLADDNVDLTSGLRRLLEFQRDIECVGCVGDARLVIGEVANCRPDVVVMDLNMPGGDTLSIVRQLQSSAPTVRTIVFSGFGDQGRIDQSLAAGAVGFVCKESDPAQLFEAIRAAASDLASALR